MRALFILRNNFVGLERNHNTKLQKAPAVVLSFVIVLCFQRQLLGKSKFHAATNI